MWHTDVFPHEERKKWLNTRPYAQTVYSRRAGGQR